MKAIIATLVFLPLLISGMVKKQSDNPHILNDTIPCSEIQIKCTQSREGNYIIRTHAEYLSKFQNLSQHPDCQSYNLPIIDFSQYTLLGIITSTGGCTHPDVEHWIIRSERGNRYKFNLKINRHGPCLVNISITIWCLIPKIDNDSSVEFLIDRKNSD